MARPYSLDLWERAVASNDPACHANSVAVSQLCCHGTIFGVLFRLQSLGIG
jgi:hypothetical protein